MEDRKPDDLFVGEGGHVIAISNMLRTILQMTNSQMIWKYLNGDSNIQRKAILEVRHHLMKIRWSVKLESDGDFFYLVIT